ncbi:O-antigen ligase family protein [Ornithobacterium rhinotracheale]|uniref:O-antigen ligase family protein n=1 Tax=Ornithobacterium rhinotracheale TaxID=28251 RepID=UPI001FF53764|nr:O-antigen ligase family protein [Ornithobacterium rhinotracheale]MCK0199840.1 O-antigen ligase family protein [Ornithobacterium rhinotracheale]UVD88262.1 O-antigen ligase family protein [Ornithobacterium rhinotracheale]
MKFWLSSLNQKNYLIATLFPLLIFIIFDSVLYFSGYNYETFDLKWLASIGNIYIFSIFLWWFVGFLVKHKSYFRDFHFWIPILLSLATILWFYSYKATAHASYIVAIIAMLYGIYKRDFYKISPSLIFLFLYALLQFMGLLWVKDISLNENQWIIEDQIPLLILPVVLCFYRLRAKDISVFCSIIFKFCLVLFIWYWIAYVLICHSAEISFLSCFGFRKDYLAPESPFGVLCFHTQKHYSFIVWLLTIVGGTSYASYYQNKSGFISKGELFIYFLFLFCFINILQVRLAQIVFFILLLVIICFEMLKSWNLRNVLIISISALSIGIFGFIFLFNYTHFFQDETRNILYSSTLAQIQGNPWFGSGTLSEQSIISKTTLDPDLFKHLHNDFLMAYIRHGVLGLVFLCLFLISYACESFKLKDYRMFFFLFPTFFLMLVDSAFFYQKTIVLTCIFIGVLYVSPKRNLA